MPYPGFYLAYGAVLRDSTNNLHLHRDTLSSALWSAVADLLPGGMPDDAGCDWFTCNGETFICDAEWKVSDDPRVAALVDAAHVVKFNRLFLLDEVEA